MRWNQKLDLSASAVSSRSFINRGILVVSDENRQVFCTVNRTKSNVGEEHYRALIQNAKGELKALRKVQVYLDSAWTRTDL